ncbi:MAG TPA: glycosyltransferase family 87 protein [Stellaceae bacterium]|nr:glycosyltransferase family 87 protein [Stellaceae bacterium]
MAQSENAAIAVGGDGWLREMRWLGRERVLAYSRILLAIAVIVACGWVATGNGLVDRNHRPFGTDFLSFWSSSALTLAGTPEAAYSEAAHVAMQERAIGAQDLPYYAWFYPPIFLLLVWPLALLPYAWSLLAWLIGTGTGYAAVLRGFAKTPHTLVPILAFPAVWVNAIHGQNGFLSTALLGGGLLLLGARRPIAAGLLFGVMIYKPQLALLLPFALIAGREWKALAAAAASATMLAGASLAAFGPKTFAAFFATSHFAQLTVEQGVVSWTKMASAFAAFRLLGASVPLAYAVQIVVAVAAAAMIARIWRGSAAYEAKAAALAAGTLLMSPFLLSYDLTLLAIPIVCLARQGMRRGFLPWEKLIVTLAWLLPVACEPIASLTTLPIAPIVIGLILWQVTRRITAEIAVAVP